MDALQASTIFSVLDLSYGFHQLPLDKASFAKTAFSTRRGLYQWTTVPFGIRNDPAAFQRLLDPVLAGLTFECCLLYLDVIIVYSKSSEQHMDALNKVFIALRDAGLMLNDSKCSFDAVLMLNDSKCSFDVNRVTYLSYALLRMRPLSISCAEGCVLISCG
jgi:hypothetical protein